MNNDKLKYLIKTKALEYKTDAQFMYRSYMFERFLERVSKSQYKNNLVVKGGFLIGAFIGIENRTTKDIDITMKGIELKVEKLQKIINEIISIDCKDDVHFEIKSITEIRESFDYNGHRILFDAITERIRIPLRLDVTTGDIIIPDEIEYIYHSLFENKDIEIMSYSIESILSEKLECIITWGIAGTRFRDYYDIFVLNQLFRKTINEEVLRCSLFSVAKQRGSLERLNDYEDILLMIAEDENFNNGWRKYVDNFEYAKNIEFADTVKIIRILLDKLVKEKSSQ